MNCKTKLLILLAITLVLVGSFYLTSTSAEHSKSFPSLKATAQGTPQTSITKSGTAPVKPSRARIATNPNPAPVKPQRSLPAIVKTNPHPGGGPLKQDQLEAQRPANAMPRVIRGTSKVNPGDDCTNPLIINLPAQLPYQDVNQTTCGRGNDYGGGTTCLGSYDGGEDIIYQVNVSSAVVVDITMDPQGTTWTGMALDTSCPPGSTCLYKSTGSSGSRILPGCSLAPGTYYIMIDTWPSPTCIPSFTLTITGAAPPPANDNCANATPIGDVTNLAFSTVNATFDGGGTCLTSPNLWYVYTASCTGTATISLCGSSYDTKMAVYDGYSCSPLPTQLGCNDDYCSLQSQLIVPVVGGNQYLIEVGGYGSSTGNGVLTTSCTPSGSAPPNDDCTGAPDINTFPTTVTGTTVGATIDCPGVLNWNSVWYKLDLPYGCNNLLVDYCPTPDWSIYQVGVVIYNSCPPNCSSYILYSGINWPTCGSGYVNPQISFTNLPAGSYWFPVFVADNAANPFHDFGITFSVAECPPAQPGDNCAMALPIFNLPFDTTGNSCGFANDYDETCPYSGGSAPDVVYSYSPATNEGINISLCNSTYDTKLFVYEDACASGTAIACNDDACGSDGYKSAIYGLGLTAGHTYYIVVDGYGTSCGDYDLSVTSAGAGPANDNCDGAVAVALPECPDVITVNGTTVGATIDCPGVLNWNSVWYKFDLPYASNKLSIDFCPTATPIATVGIVLYNSCPVDCPSYILTSGYQWTTCPNGNTGPQLWWNGLPAGTYYLPVYLVDYSGSPFMDFSFNACVQPLVAPPNDNCENATPVGDVTNLAFSTAAASFDGPGLCQTAPNVWYCYTASCNGNAHIALCGSSYDTKLGVYDGCTCPPTTLLGCNDDGCGGYLQSDLSIPVVMGQTYLIEVGGFASNTGDGFLSISCALPPPNDECTGAPIINTFPQTVSGTTIGASVDCPGVLDWNAVWYEFDLPYTCNNLDVNFCATNNAISTVGIVLYNSCPPDCPNYILATGYNWLTCANGYSNPEVYWNGLPAGHYWFPVYLGTAMDFTFDVSADSCVPCVVTCPPGAMLEGEPDCYDNYVDTTNGGCNSTPNVFENITCNTTVCGTSGTYIFSGSQYRDTDWYQVQVSDGTLTWKVVAEFPVLIILIAQSDCTNPNVLASATANPCDTALISQYVPAGIYWLWVGPSAFAGVPCGSKYVGRIECTGMGPQIVVTPTSISKTLPPGATSDVSLYLSNSGSENLDFEIDYNLSNTWLGVAPRFGTIPPAGSDTINVHLDASAVGLGTYNDVLKIASNSVGKQLDDTTYVPVQLTVAYPPNIEVQPELSVGVLPGCNMEKPLKVSNTGLGPLNFEAHVSGNPPLKVGITQRTYQEGTKGSSSHPLLAGKIANLNTNNPARLSLGVPSTPGTPLRTSGDTLFMQMPKPADDPDWSFATSDAGAGYRVEEDIWGLSEQITGIQWWGLALIYNAGWNNGTPENLVFDINFYSDPISTMPPTNVVCSYTNVTPTIVHTGIFFAGIYEEILFSWDLPSPCNLPSGYGWVSIQSQSAGQGYDWFLWASALTGDGYSYQEGNGEYMYDDALILVGGTGCPFTVAPSSGTVAGGGSTELVLTFDGSVFTQCNDETLSCYVVITSNDPDEPVVSTKVDFWSGRGDVFQPTCFVDIGDVVFLVNYVLKNGPAPSPLCMGDCDPSHDGVVDLADIVYLTQFLFQKGSPPQVSPATHSSPIQR